MNYGSAAAIAVTGGGRRQRLSDAKGSVPIGLGALVIGIALLWIGLVLNDIVEGVARGVIGVVALLLAFRAVERFKAQQFVGAVILAILAVGVAIFAIV